MNFVRLRPWMPAVGWAAVIFVLSSFPGSAHPGIDLPSADKLVHLALYAPLGALGARGFWRGTRLSRSFVTTITAVLAAIYGITDELHQMLVPGRNADWRDAVADAFGGLVGAVAMIALLRRRRG